MCCNEEQCDACYAYADGQEEFFSDVYGEDDGEDLDEYAVEDLGEYHKEHDVEYVPEEYVEDHGGYIREE